jgi:uncharacterized protein
MAMRMAFGKWMAAAAAALLMAMAVATVPAAPAAAQFSDSYNFLKAVRDKDVLKAKGFLDKPGSVLANTRDRDSGDAALHIVTKRGDVPWIAFLLQQGADANIKDRDGNSAMILAAQAGFTDGIRVLLLARASVNQPNNRGETALIKAVQLRDLSTARQLIEAGADPDRTDNAAGLSARDYAAQDRRSGPLAKLLAETPKRAAAPAVGPKF